ncbi:unnamed protein product, partial [Allacma fusca]
QLCSDTHLLVFHARYEGSMKTCGGGGGQ